MYTITGDGLKIGDLAAVADRRVSVSLSEEAVQRMDAAHETLLAAAAGEQAIYGVNTGFGPLRDQRIDADHLVELQFNLIRSHAAGVGPPLPARWVRGAMLLLANCLAHGSSGIETDTVRLIVEFLNRGIHPVVPCQGSLGASGDLAPLAHVALCLIGEGVVECDGVACRAGDLGLPPANLGPKSGLALINGTHFLTAGAALAADLAGVLIRSAEIVAAMHVEASLSSVHPFDEGVHALRPHRGQREVAANMRALTSGSALVASHAHCSEVQDAYSVRCVPQIHGAVRDAHHRAVETLEIEMSSVTDNPLIVNGELVSAGNFHGEPCALIADYLSLAIVELGNVSERRTERLLNASLSRGLPAFLAHTPGLESGLMIAHYAAAAIASENKGLAYPASADTIPTGANQEDHNSMGFTSARRLNQICENVLSILAIETLCAARALRLRMNCTGLAPGPASLAALERVEDVVPFGDSDEPPSPHISALAGLLRAGSLCGAVESVTGELP